MTLIRVSKIQDVTSRIRKSRPNGYIRKASTNIGAFLYMKGVSFIDVLHSIVVKIDPHVH
jgi:hypothetical protein